MPGFFQAVAASPVMSTVQTAILDGYTTNLDIALGPVLLVPNYAGNCIRIRRSSDNAEQDIGFNGIHLDTAAINSFCSGTNGFVKTWYSQTGSYNATQAATASQPKIYDSSTGIELDNLIPTLDFDGSNDYLQTSYSSNNNYTAFWVQTPVSNVGGTVIGRGDSNSRHVVSKSGASNRVIHYRLGGFAIETDIVNSRYLGYALVQQSSSSCRVGVNGTTGTTTSSLGSGTLANMCIGAERSSINIYGNSRIQVLAIYSGDQSSNRAGIESAINNFFNVYS